MKSSQELLKEKCPRCTSDRVYVSEDTFICLSCSLIENGMGYSMDVQTKSENIIF